MYKFIIVVQPAHHLAGPRVLTMKITACIGPATCQTHADACVVGSQAVSDQHPAISDPRAAAAMTDMQLWLQVIDMPLLFETGANRLVQPAVVVSCTPDIQVLPDCFPCGISYILTTTELCLQESCVINRLALHSGVILSYLPVQPLRQAET